MYQEGQPPIDFQTGKQQLCVMGSDSVLTLQVKEGEHAAARQRMGPRCNNENL